MASEIKEDSNSQSEVKTDDSIDEKSQDFDVDAKGKKSSLNNQTPEKEELLDNKTEDKAKEEDNKEDTYEKEKVDSKPEKLEKKDDIEDKKDQPKEKKDVLKGKEQAKDKDQSKKEEPEESDEGSDEEEVGLLDRPVEVSGCRARKKVERLEIGFSTPKEKQELLEGKGKKLGECPRIEAQIQKMKVQDLKPLHKILFNRVGSGNEIKKNIRKFSGFPFDENSTEFNRKKTSLEKLTMAVLKQTCSVLDIERGGMKDEIISRIMSFLLNPEDSGKKVPSKKKSTKDKIKEKKKSSGKKGKADKKSKSEKSEDSDDNVEDENEEDDSGGDESMGGSDEENDAVSDDEPSTKSKGSKTKGKTEKGKKNEKSKSVKRKADSLEDSENEKLPKKANKMPSDDEISKLVKDILEAADLQEITMKKVIKQVSDAYPDFDLSHKKAFIKSTIKSVIS